MVSSILIVDDEPRISLFLERVLAREGYEITISSSGADALRAVREGSFGLIILDLMMPGMDGYEVIRRLDRSDDSPPILVLSAITEVADRVHCLSMGAADYLTKPFAVSELCARVAARIRESPHHAPERWLRVGSSTLDFQRLSLVVDGRSVSLSPREFLLLEYLMRDAGEVHTRDELLSHVWGWNVHDGSNVVDVCVRRLRRKLQKELIETVRNVGYAFVVS